MKYLILDVINFIDFPILLLNNLNFTIYLSYCYLNLILKILICLIIVNLPPDTSDSVNLLLYYYYLSLIINFTSLLVILKNTYKF